jgi:oxepin-CoA hydrolase/3-oxo-5,6-dehydrosuberyl-CoA semialdehyde dehydrogenase
MNNEIYLKSTVPQLLDQLTPDHTPSFGLLTPQHMVEHLIWVTKSSAKDYGPAPEQLTEGNEKFMKFVKTGANFEYRPSTKTAADLPALRMESLAAAIAEVPQSIERLYQFAKDHEFYNPMMGRLSFDELELLTAKHFQHHLENQYGLKLDESV